MSTQQTINILTGYLKSRDQTIAQKDAEIKALRDRREQDIAKLRAEDNRLRTQIGELQEMVAELLKENKELRLQNDEIHKQNRETNETNRKMMLQMMKMMPMKGIQFGADDFM